MSFAQRATFGRGHTGSGYALAAPRDDIVSENKKIFYLIKALDFNFQSLLSIFLKLVLGF